MVESESTGSSDASGCENNWMFYALLLAAYLPYLAIFWFLSTNPTIFSVDEAKGLFGYSLLGILVMSGVLFAYSMQVPLISGFYRQLGREQPAAVALIFLTMGIVGILAIYFAWPLSVELGKNWAIQVLLFIVVVFSISVAYLVRRTAVNKFEQTGDQSPK